MSGNVLKFRNLFCLIHKLCIALVLKKIKIKTVKPRHYFKVQALPAFQMQELLKLCIPIGRLRKKYEWEP